MTQRLKINHPMIFSMYKFNAAFFYIPRFQYPFAVAMETKKLAET